MYSLWNIEILKRQLSEIKNQFGKSVNCYLLEKWIAIISKFISCNEELVDKSRVSSETINFHSQEEATEFLKEQFTLKKANVTAAIIVKDEERVIERCLKSILDKFDDIVVVDTGSVDRTIELIKNLKSSKIKLYQMEWKENFSEARNFALDQVNTDWVFFIDADEELADMDYSVGEILAVFDKMGCSESITLSPRIIDADENNYIGVRRIFRKDSGIRYYGLVHEEPRKIADNKIVMINNVCVDIPIKHDGYKPDVLQDKNKVIRNLSLLNKMKNIEPDNPRWAYFYMRDGFQEITFQEVNKIINKFVLLDDKKILNVDNLQEGEYIFPLLNLFAQFKLREEKYDELTPILDCLKKIDKDNNDIMYLRTYAKMCMLKNEWQQLLKEMVAYRDKHFDIQYGTMHSEGKHLDFLIGVLLFETGHVEKAFSYFKFTEDLENFKPLIQYYYNIMDRCKSYSII